MEADSNKCQICQTEFRDTSTKKIADNNFSNYQKNYQKHYQKYYQIIKEKNKHLEEKIEELNQTIQELQIKLKAYENKEKPEEQYNAADNEEIQELIDKLKHPLVVEVIKGIINENQEKQSNKINYKNQEDSVINEVEVELKNEDLDDTENSEIKKESQDDDYSEPALILTPLELELVNKYKINDPKFRESIIIVSESEETQENRRSGRKTNTIFQKNHLGNYWIYPSEESLYIFPPEKLTINDYNQETIESVFECNGYSHTQSKNAILVKPGKVNPIGTDKWEVLERGILQFQ